MPSRRYPGSRPFQDNDQDRLLFYGRESEARALFHLILAEDVVLFYAKSGIGKTSLLNAGVFQQLRDKEYFPCMLRLNRPESDPILDIQDQIRDRATQAGLELQVPHATYAHLWPFFCDLRLWQDDILLTPVLVFDQFEELFTLNGDLHRGRFINQFASLLRQGPPPELKLPGERDGSMPRRPPLKFVLSMREDYLGEIEQVAAEAPKVMHNRFRLTALTREQAKSAIQKPAELTGAGLPGHGFQYEPQAMDQMLDFLCERRNRRELVKGNEVEPFQLQILCQHLEDRVLLRQSNTSGPAVVSASELGGREGMEAILQQFYNRQIEQIPKEQQAAVKRLCETGLISETEKRVSLEVEDIGRRFDVGEQVLEKMVELRLLRAERRVGSVYYELSHDTLVSAILRNKKDIDTVYRSAEEYTRSNDFIRATEVLNDAIARGIRDATIFHLLGKALASRRELKKAISAYEEAVKLAPSEGFIWADLGDAYAQDFESEKAGRASLSPPDGSRSKSAGWLGAAAQGDNESEKAVYAYTRALDLDPLNPNPYKQLALFHIRRGENAKAVRLFEEAVLFNDEAAYIFQDIVAELNSQNARDEALQICKIALATDSRSDTLYFDIAYELGKLNDFEHAVEGCEKSARLNAHNSATFNNWGVYLARLNRSEEAIEKYKQAIEIDRTYVLSYKNCADVLWDLNRREEALEKFRQASEIAPQDPRVFGDWAYSLGQMGRHEEALEKFERLRFLDPILAGDLNNWGFSLEKLGRGDEALEKYRQALEVDPKYSLASRNYADMLWELGRREEAFEVHRKATENDPENPRNFAHWAWSLGQAGRHEEALEKFEKVASLGSPSAWDFNNWGWSLDKLGRVEESLEKYRQALEVDPKYALASSNYASKLWDVGRREEALEVYRKAAEADPANARAFGDWGFALGQMERHEEAVEKFERMASLSSPSALELNNWGWSLEKLGRVEEAIEKFRKGIAVDPSYELAYTNLADALTEANRSDEAIEVWGKLEELKPENALAFAWSGIVLSKCGRIEEAREKLRRAEELNPEDATGMASLAWGLYLNGDFQKSIWWGRRALEKDAEMVGPQFNLGLALLHTGELQEARLSYEKALELSARLNAREDLVEATDDLLKAIERNPGLPGSAEILAKMKAAQNAENELSQQIGAA